MSYTKKSVLLNKFSTFECFSVENLVLVNINKFSFDFVAEIFWDNLIVIQHTTKKFKEKQKKYEGIRLWENF